MSYNKKTWMCPYYKSDDKNYIKCEAGKIEFDTGRATMLQYADAYCADEDWENCTLAKMLTGSYDRILERLD